MATASCDWLALEFVEAFHYFNLVRISCFGNILDPNYSTYIVKFKTAIESLQESTKLSITPKFHTIFFHIKWWCEKNQRALGIASEQTAESIHSRVNRFLTNYGNFDPLDPNIPQKLCNAVAKLNALSILEDKNVDIFAFLDSDCESD